MEDELWQGHYVRGYTLDEYIPPASVEDFLFFLKILFKSNFGVWVPVIHFTSLQVMGNKQSIIVAGTCHRVFLLGCTTKGSCHKCDFGAIDFWVNFQCSRKTLLYFNTSSQQIKISISLPVLNSMKWQPLLCPPDSDKREKLGLWYVLLKQTGTEFSISLTRVRFSWV